MPGWVQFEYRQWGVRCRVLLPIGIGHKHGLWGMRRGILLSLRVICQYRRWAVRPRVLLPGWVRLEYRQRGVRCRVLLPIGIGHKHGLWGMQPCVRLLLPYGLCDVRRDAVPCRQVLRAGPGDVTLRLCCGVSRGVRLPCRYGEFQCECMYCWSVLSGG